MKRGAPTSSKGMVGIMDLQASICAFSNIDTSANVHAEVLKYKKQPYVSWNKEMDNHLARVLTSQMVQGNKCDGDTWKPQALQVVSHPDAKCMQNKMIENYDDTVLLCGKDRATGQGAETFEEGADAIGEEDENEVNLTPLSGPRLRAWPSSSTDSMHNKEKKAKKDSLAEVVSVIASTFEEVVASKKKSQEKPSGIEIHEVVSMVPGLTINEIFKVVRELMNGDVEEFNLLKALLDEKKKDWVYFFINS
ncbi:hypothetical protein DH2020_017090 [Rehmannia glutinosa]|uniref:DUF4219 domain-containing protein n=1 Tax=Rehmannia glutinosa TaxID=99300 RepID=A0ABR0WU56_REHGL